MTSGFASSFFRGAEQAKISHNRCTHIRHCHLIMNLPVFYTSHNLSILQNSIWSLLQTLIQPLFRHSLIHQKKMLLLSQVRPDNRRNVQLVPAVPMSRHPRLLLAIG